MHDHGRPEPDDVERFYAAGPRWSGLPNEALVHEAGRLTPGRALDIGCGEGADAVWLAEQGWEVTAIDPVAAALERARTLADAHGVTHRITFRQQDLTGFPGLGSRHASTWWPAATSPFPEDRDLATGICRLVGPGGALVWIHHLFDIREERMILDPGYLEPLLPWRSSAGR
ncbi:methyltransferase domain-containing protein [Corynebacterium suedekumii]|nr:methyltransferase domain-containing protein [Corynebacterium suedekumii]